MYAACVAGSDCGSCEADRKPPEPKIGKLFAYRALMHDNTEALFDQVLQVGTLPTHHAVHLRVRTRANDLGKFRRMTRRSGNTNGINF